MVLPRGLCGGDATTLVLTERAFDASNTPDKRRPSEVLPAIGLEDTDAATCAVLANAEERSSNGSGDSDLAWAKKSFAVAKVGRMESSGEGVEQEDCGCSPSGDVRASKKWLSSLTGVKTGSTLERLGTVLIRPVVSGRPEEATSVPLARLSRSAAALRADFEIKVAEPSDICFLWPDLLLSRLTRGTTLSSDCEAGIGSGSGSTNVLYTASGESASRAKRESLDGLSSSAPSTPDLSFSELGAAKAELLVLGFSADDVSAMLGPE